MKVSFNSINPGFNGCYKLPRAEFDSWEKILKKNLDKNNPWDGACPNIISALNCGMPVGFTYITKKAGPVMYFLGKHGLDNIIEEAKRRCLFTGPTKKESQEYDIPRKRRYSISALNTYLNKLNQLRLEKAKEMEIDYASLFDGSKCGVYIFTGQEDAQDYFDYITRVTYDFTQKYRSKKPERTFWQRIADKFKPKKPSIENQEPYFYRGLREIVDENNCQQKAFDEFIAKKDVKEFKTVEELAKEVFNA